MRTRHADAEATFSQLVGLIAIAVLVQFSIDFLRVGPGGEFFMYGLPNLLFKIPVIIVAAWLFSLPTRNPACVLALAVLVTAIAIPVGLLSDLVVWLLESRAARRLVAIPGDYRYLFEMHFAAAWLAIASVVAAARRLGLPWKRWSLAAFAGAAVIWFFTVQAGTYQSIWTEAYNPDSTQRQAARHRALTDERAFYEQQRLLEQALASIGKSQPDRINLYFVGVAAYAGQDVFMKEVQYVSSFFKARFGTIGRSVSLINNPKTVLETPAASVTSLRLVLNRVGKSMDADKDILFLFLTSHGAQNHALTFEFGAARFDPLDPATLRKLLDDAGIKRRVVVVSACYSGGFVEPLADANTLVITASAPDRASHGCSNEADFTFFGKAYFEDGLRKTDSFIEAFEIAQPLIAERETKDGYDPAQPMMSAGSEIREALARYQVQLQDELLIQQKRAVPTTSGAPAQTSP